MRKLITLNNASAFGNSQINMMDKNWMLDKFNNIAVVCSVWTLSRHLPWFISQENERNRVLFFRYAWRYKNSWKRYFSHIESAVIIHLKYLQAKHRLVILIVTIWLAKGRNWNEITNSRGQNSHIGSRWYGKISTVIKNNINHLKYINNIHWRKPLTNVRSEVNALLHTSPKNLLCGTHRDEGSI